LFVEKKGNLYNVYYKGIYNRREKKKKKTHSWFIYEVWDEQTVDWEKNNEGGLFVCEDMLKGVYGWRIVE